MTNQSKSTLWGRSEPNGKRRENCVGLSNPYDLFDISCNSKLNTICDMTTAPVFTIRGLCQETNFDLQYSLTGQLSTGKNPKYKFAGSDSLLFWDGIKEYWKLVKINDNSSYAINNETGIIYPIGTHPWYFFNDSCVYESEKSGNNVYLAEIAITMCKEDMYNCRDGTW